MIYSFDVPCAPCAALTIATIPALTASGKCSHAPITSRRSSGTFCCTHVTHFECNIVFFCCSPDVCSCSSMEEPGCCNVLICLSFVRVCIGSVSGTSTPSEGWIRGSNPLFSIKIAQSNEDFPGPVMAWGRVESCWKPRPEPRAIRVTGAV